MPIKQAAKKALRQSLKRQKRNLAYYNKIKGLIKKARNLVAQAQAKREDEQSSSLSQKKINEAKSLLPQIYQALDKAAKVGVIKKNAATRKKSRITKLVGKA